MLDPTATQVTVTDEPSGQGDSTRLSLGDISVNEGSGTATVTGTLSHPAGMAFTVTLSNQATLFFAAGATEAVSTPFAIQGDDVYQDGETFSVSVSDAGAHNFEQLDISDSATVTVNDTDTPVTAVLSVSSASVTEGDSISYTVTLTGPAGMDLSQHGGLTFTLANGETVTITDGEISGSSASVDTSGQTQIDNAIKNVVGDEKYEELITAGNTSVNVNHSPVATSANAQGLEDSAGIEIKLSATDAGGSVKSFIINTLPENGTLFLGEEVVTSGMEISADDEGELTLTFVPTKDWSGDTSFNYQAVDNAGVASAEASLNIKVQPVTDVPQVTVELGEPVSQTQSINIGNVKETGLGFTVTAYNLNGGKDQISTYLKSNGTVEGFGVANNGGSGAATEIGQKDGKSEMLAIDFDVPVTELTAQFSWLSSSEYAKYELKDSNGKVIGSGIVKGTNDTIEAPFTVTGNNDALISRIEFTAPNAAQGGSNNSDYLIHKVSYTTAKIYSLEITATPTDSDFSEEITSIIVKVPGGAELSHGNKSETADADGLFSWTLPLENSDGYTVVIDEATGKVTIEGVSVLTGSSKALELTVIATAQDGAADEQSTSMTISGSAESGGEGAVPTIAGLGIEGGDLVLDESHLASGTQTDTQSLTQSGSFKVAASQGIKSLTIAGKAVISDGVFNETTITSPLGNTLTMTGYDPETGDVTYSYTLDQSNTHAPDEDALFDEFAVQLEQNGGGSASGSLSIRIEDDEPTVSFANAVTASSVINGFWSAEAGADTLPGLEMIQQIVLDGVTVAGKAAGNLQLSESNVAGVYPGSFSYGNAEGLGGVKEVIFTLTLNEDGSYQIALSAEPVQISITPENFDKAVKASGPTDTYEISYKDVSTSGTVKALVSVAEEDQTLTLHGMNNTRFTANTTGSSVNASKDGIGIGNNIINSYHSKKTGLTSESLIYNPAEAASAINLSFKGKGDPGFGQGKSTDVLYLTVTGTNGSTQTIMLDSRYGDYVVDADGFKEIEGGYVGGALDGYTVNNPFGAGEAIDQLEVTAGFYDDNGEIGTTNVKVNFGFSIEQEQALPLPVEMDFTVTATDADGDTTEAAFTAGMQASGSIEGTDRDDAITGTEGSDWLAGGLGDDIIDLGADDGAEDILYWSAEEAQSGQSQSDTVKGFELNEDKLDLSDFLTDKEQEDLGNYLSVDGDENATTVSMSSDNGASLNITLDGVAYEQDILSQILVDELVGKLPDNG
ncbi:immunoglobulin-like domain-containing protein [Oceanisphaera sediminis]|uniref:immunoglobulin-like domain-containing protein n=1 Tax=Oceanisphaera sediminis TaxID=981381 RepID=UPI0031E61BC7